MTRTDLAGIAAAIERARRLLLTTHLRPDGDAVGSVTGLAHALVASGREVHLVMVDPPGERFDFLAAGLVVAGPADIAPPYDLAVAVDCGDFERTGMMATLAALGAPIVNIDHHASNPGFGDLSYVDPDASSTAEIVHALIRIAGWPLGLAAARSLFAGICTDTRFFQNPGVRAATFRAAADLLEAGLDPEPVVTALAAGKSLVDLRVLGLGLSKTQAEAGGRLLWTQLSQAELAALGAGSRAAWSAGLFGTLNTSVVARAVVAFIEAEDGRWFAEFRSKPGFEVQAIAARFGGGGHRQASGCQLGSAAEIPAVLAALREALGGP